MSEKELKELLARSIQKAIKEILPPVVDRSVTIALITTTELVAKDFSYDSDVQKVELASNLIVKNLAGSLAAVTCREPLKMSLSEIIKKDLTNLKNQIIREDSSINPNFLNESAISDFATAGSKENIDLGCKEIQSKVISQALTKVREN